MDDESWRLLAEQQQGLVTRRQLTAAGVTPAALRWRLGRTWRLVLPNVVAVQEPPPGGSWQLVAAMLEAGAGAVLTGHRACAWLGLRSALGARPVRVLVPGHRASRDVGFVHVRRTSRPDAEPLRRGVLVVASPARAVMDAARESPRPDDARGVVIEAVQRRVVTVEDLEHELAAGPHRGSRLARDAVQEARAGAWSVPEADLLRLCARSRVLPPVLPNPALEAVDRAGTVRRLVSPDGWVDDVGLALMVHSREHHSRDLDWEGTVERDGELNEHGVTVLAFTPRTIARRPEHVLSRIERTYLALVRSGRQRPSVRTLVRGHGLSA